MPIKKCIKNGKIGYKYGDNGICYIGLDGKSKAIKQGQAIALSKNYRSKKIKKK